MITSIPPLKISCIHPLRINFLTLAQHKEIMFYLYIAPKTSNKSTFYLNEILPEWDFTWMRFYLDEMLPEWDFTWMRLAGSLADLYPSKKARAVLNAGVGIPRVTAVATTFLHDSCEKTLKYQGRSILPWCHRFLWKSLLN